MPHTVEEAYEVADAALADAAAKLLDELGDLLFQVYFLSLLLEEQGAGRPRAGGARDSREARARGIRTSSGTSRRELPGRVRGNWEQHQARATRGARGSSTTCPSRFRRCSTRERCSGERRRSGSSTRTSPGRSPICDDELRELKEALAAAGEPAPEAEPDPHVFDELGDVLFAAVNVARRLNVDPELALRARDQALCRPGGAGRGARRRRRREFAELPLDEQDRYFDAAKEELR